MEKILSDFGVQPILLLAQIVNFLVLLFILQKFLYKPLLKVLADRKKQIEESILNSEKIQKELEETEVKREKVIAEAIEEGKKIIAEAGLSANELMIESQTKAKSEMESIMESGRLMIISEKDKMKSEIKTDVANLVGAAIEKVLGNSVDTKTHQKLVDDAVKGMKL